MADDLFNIDIVRDFMIDNGGKVRNHELVTHFKNFLSDPKFKGSNRQKFKTFVNTLATVKLDETGEKVLVLKKKFREEESVAPSTSTAEKSYKREPPKAKLKDSFPVRKPSEDEDQGQKTGGESLLDSIQKELSRPKQDAEPPTPHPDYDESIEEVEEPTPDYAEPDGSMAEPQPDYGESTAKDDSEVFLDEAAEPEKPVSHGKEEAKTVRQDTEDGSVSGRLEKEPKEEKMDVQEAVPVSTSQVRPQTEHKRQDSIKEKEPNTQSERTTKPADASEDLEGTINIKDRVKHLNKISSTSNLQGSPGHPRKSYKKYDNDEGGQGMIHLNDVEREWLIMSAKADYQDMAKVLSKNPQLAKRKDFTNTALHWAAKHGNLDIVKMLCGTEGVQVNDISGYTPLHLAAIQGHEDVIELLVQVYRADANIRDHSGKKPKQYLKNAATARVQQLLQVGKPSQSIASSFKRSGSYSSKINAAGHFGIKANTAMRTSWADSKRSISRSPIGSPKQSPNISRKGSNADDFLMMPPPQEVPARRKKSKHKSTPMDSIRAKLRAQSDPFIAISSRYGTNNGSSQDMSRAESDPALSKSEVNPPVHQSTSYTSFV